MQHHKKCGRFIGKKAHKCVDTSWNKGTKGVMKANKTSFKKGSSGFTGKHTENTKQFFREKFRGIHFSRRTEIKKGQHISPQTEFKKEQVMGSKNPNWKGGITPENIKIRTGIEMNLWRNAVYARDGYTCQKTGIKGGKLTVHHILNFSSHKELRFAINNGITLLVQEHKNFHKKYGIKNNTREQLSEFLNNK